MKGLFITFEGGEGTGKSTVLSKLKAFFDENKIEYIFTREPGGTLVSEKIREVILDVQNPMDSLTEAYLYAASRIEHIKKKIEPALKEGKIVISDRYLDSSLVYQGIARGLGIDLVLKINRYALSCMPDKTFFFDLKPSVGFERIKRNNREMDRLDLENMDFHERVYEGYQIVKRMYPDRIISIQACKSREEVYDDVLREIKKLLER